MLRHAVVALLLAAPAMAYTQAEIGILDPSLSASSVFSGNVANDDFLLGGDAGATLADGSLVIRSEPRPLDPGDPGSPFLDYVYVAAGPGGVRELFGVPELGTGCSILTADTWTVSDVSDGALIFSLRCNSHLETWRINGLPRPDSVGTCPQPGDVFPGPLDTATTPPTARVTGDGAVNVSDVVRLLRVAVGLERLECGP